MKEKLAFNKTNATLRYLALDNCFQNRVNKYFIDDLIIECFKSLEELNAVQYVPSILELKENNKYSSYKRIIYNDINFMCSEKGYNAPIEEHKVGRKVYKKYSDSNFSIIKQKYINQLEKEQILKLIDSLERFKWMKDYEWINDITIRLKASFGFKTSLDPVISYENNPYVKGLEYLPRLLKAIENKIPQKVVSKSFSSGKIETYEFHPHFLKQYNNRWFVFGFNATENNKYFKKALDRIEKFEDLDINFKESLVNFNEYLQDLIGVSSKGNHIVEKVKLRVSKDLWPYVQTKPIHESQSFGGKENLKTLEKGYVDITLNVVLNYELESKILERGEGFEVLEPLELRNKIADRVKKLNSKYNCA